MGWNKKRDPSGGKLMNNIDILENTEQTFTIAFRNEALADLHGLREYLGEDDLIEVIHVGLEVIQRAKLLAGGVSDAYDKYQSAKGEYE